MKELLRNSIEHPARTIAAFLTLTGSVAMSGCASSGLEGDELTRCKSGSLITLDQYRAIEDGLTSTDLHDPSGDADFMGGYEYNDRIDMMGEAFCEVPVSDEQLEDIGSSYVFSTGTYGNFATVPTLGGEMIADYLELDISDDIVFDDVTID
jgi:hypothetical protein